MVLPIPSNVVIECPNCGTRYQLPADTIGASGRQVACAHCGKTWKAKALPSSAEDQLDAIFDEAAEADLDAQFGIAEAEARTEDPNWADHERTLAEIRTAVMAAEKPAPAPTPKSDERAFTRRQLALNRQLPIARARRGIRVASVLALMLVIGAGLIFRTEIVKRFPDLAGAYAALGLPVNVVGLEFRDVTTLVTLRNGDRVMRVDGRIFSVAQQRVAVPKAVVTLLDDHGAPIYEWSIAPEASELEPGEVVDFTAQLTSPPAGASSMRIGFMDGRTQAEDL